MKQLAADAAEDESESDDEPRAPRASSSLFAVLDERDDNAESEDESDELPKESLPPTSQFAGLTVEGQGEER